MIRRLKAVCCLHRSARFLMMLRFDDAQPDRRFLIPVGGQMEPGESPVEAARREVWEELSIGAESLRFLGILEDKFRFRGQHLE